MGISRCPIIRQALRSHWRVAFFKENLPMAQNLRLNQGEGQEWGTTAGARTTAPCTAAAEEPGRRGSGGGSDGCCASKVPMSIVPSTTRGPRVESRESRVDIRPGQAGACVVQVEVVFLMKVRH